MSIQIAVFGIALLANVLLGLLVVLRNPKSWTNRLFFLHIATMNTWALFNVLSSQREGNLVMARLVLFWAVVFAFIFFLFVNTFPDKEFTLKKRYLILSSLLSVIAMGLTLSPLVFKEIVVPADGGLGSPAVGPGIALFALTVLFFDFGGLFLLFRKVLRSKSSERVQVLYLFLGLGVMKIMIIVLNFILPTVFKDTRFIPYASIFMLPFVLFTSYAIVKHHLLDIRATVARALAYIVSLGFIGLVYGVVIFGLTSGFSLNENPSLQRVVYIAVALVTALLYQRTKSFFDRVTNRIFYQDAYDPQLFLDRLNTVLVAHIDMQPLLKLSAELIEQTLKTEFCAFIIKDSATGSQRVIGAGGSRLDPKDIAFIVTEYRSRNSVMLADDLGLTNSPLKVAISRNNIAVIVRLGGNRNQSSQGYLLLGNKRSGNPYNRQDIQVLEIIANELVIAIQNALRFEEIQTFNVTLQDKVNAATRQLRKTNEKLKDLDQSKDEFISMASHQLRTPLTSVKGYVSMVMEGDAGKLTKKQNELLAQAFASSQRMVYLISDLLNVSRLQTGKFVIENKPTELPEVVETELSQLTEAAKARNLELSYHKPAKFPALMLDETKIRQVIMNFVDNAIYYTPTGGHIKVELVDKPTSVEFTVVDDGLGVPKADQHHLFSKFYRAGNARKARPDGTGLGLFMAQKVIVAQGGAIIFTSTEGKGSTFGFTLPKAKLQVHESTKS